MTHTNVKEKHVNQDTVTQDGGELRSYLHTPISRAGLFAAAATGLTAAAVPWMAHAQTTSAPETQQDILNIRDTQEHFDVALLTAAINNATALGLTANGGLLLRTVQGALAAEQFHIDYLESVGAQPLPHTLTLPDPRILTDPIIFFQTLEFIETIEVGMDMSATRQFSQMGNAMLAQNAYQIGGVEAEHRLLARAALATLGQTVDIPPNNKAFEADVVYYLRDAVTIFTNMGFVDGPGQQVPYPGRAAALAAVGPVLAKVTDQKP